MESKCPLNPTADPSLGLVRGQQAQLLHRLCGVICGLAPSPSTGIVQRGPQSLPMGGSGLSL